MRKYTQHAALGALLALVMGLFVTFTSPAAQAAGEGYRYWGLWQLQGGKWTFATKGAAELQVNQGDVIGLRYAAAGQSDSRPPRDATVTFEKVCGTQKVDAGKQAVAVVIDYGRPADTASGTDKAPQPKAMCAVVDQGATVASMLKSVADVRNDAKGMICGIDNWPAQGCSEEVAKLSDAAKAKDEPVAIAVQDPGAVNVAPGQGATDAAATPTASPAEGKNDGPSNGVILAIAALALLALAAAAVLFMRRARRNETSARVVGSATPRSGATATTRRADSPAERVRETDAVTDERRDDSL